MTLMDVYMLCTSRNAYPLMDLLARVVLLLYISAWASALLVQTSWAMPEPLCVGRVTVDSHASFYISVPVNLFINSRLGS